MTTLTVDTAELTAALAAAIAQALAARPAVPRLYTSEQVSDFTGNAVQPTWLEQAGREERIPVRKVGRALRWTLEDIEAAYAIWLQKPRNAPRR